jgi:hypothetical protein
MYPNISFALKLPKNEINRLDRRKVTVLVEIFFANRTLTLKETTNSTKHLTKTKIVLKSLRCPSSSTASTARRRCRSSESRPDIVGCGQKVAERAQKATYVPEIKKKG